MKKLLSMLIVAVMLFAAVASSVPVLAKDQAEYDEVSALYFDVEPTLDGIVSEAEWGPATVLVRQSDAATADDTSPKNNRYFTLNTGATPRFDASARSMSYTMWLRWDEDFYYIAVKVQDPDGHSLKKGKNEVWNGDGFQTRIDSLGPNYTSESGDPYDYDAARDGKPWSNDSLDDFCIGFVESAGGFSEAWENKSNKGVTEYSNNPLGAVKVSVAPCGTSYSADSSAGITTYEIAIPWAFIEQSGTSVEHTYTKNTNKNPGGGIDREYGMSAVVYNADGASGADHYNAGLGWGSGIINDQQNNHPGTCDGSNSVTLSGDKVSASAGYTGNYTSAGGYVAPAKEFDYPTAIDESTHVKLTYDNESDLEIFGLQFYGERVKDESGEWVLRMDKATDDMPDDRTEDVTMPDGSVVKYNANNYMSTDGLVEGADPAYTSNGCSYTMEFDVKILDNVTFEPGYSSFLTNWFGGSKGVDYTCGYYFEDGKFEIRERTQNTIVASSDPVAFSANEWHHWVFQYFKDNCEMRFYFDPPMEGGRVSANAVPVFKKVYRYFDAPGLDKCILILCRMNCQALFDNVEFYNFVDFTKTGAKTQEDTSIAGGGGGYTPAPVKKDEIIDVDFTVTKRDDGTFAVGIPNEEKFKAQNVTAVSFTVDITKADGKLLYKAIEDVAAEAVTVTDNNDGTLTIKVNDLKIFAGVDAGKAILNVIFEPANGANLTVDDVKGFVKIKATVTTVSAQTGDNAVVYISAALLVAALLAAGIVVYSKKRRCIDL